MSAYQEESITLAMGSGGRSYHRLIEEVFLPAFGNPLLNGLNDSALCPAPGREIALTTDGFVVRPRFFPGGDIGRLAVCGTVNDLAVSGAEPAYLSCAMVLETGLPLSELRTICASMAKAAREAGARVVTGDTKVVEKGGCDGIFITTAGVGLFREGRRPLPQLPQPGDAIILSGTMGDHGLAVLAARQALDFQPAISSDVAPLNGAIAALLAAAPGTRALRDATRGGVAAVANEWAAAAGRDILLALEDIPIRANVSVACELLGLDPLLAANEGKFLAAVPPEQAQAALSALREHPYGKEAAIIGQLLDQGGGRVLALTPYGSRRLVDMPDGDQLPRIC